MPNIECFLCLKIKKGITNSIKIGSSEWNEQHIENVIEKHLWPMAFLKSKSRWLCSACWQILHDFHDFYKRVKVSNECYDFMFKSENDMDTTEDYNVNDFLGDAKNKQPSKKELSQESLDDNTDDDSYTDETKDHIIEEKPPPNVETHETVILKDDLSDNDYITTEAAQGNDEHDETKNPLELASATGKLYKFTCDICQEAFKSFGILSHHFRRAHDQEAYMVCCGIKFVSRSVFGEHIQSHLNPESLKCKYCHKSLKNKRNLVYHIARWHEGSIFHCKVCNKRFADQIKYQQHSEEHQDLFLDSVNNGNTNEYEGDDENSAVHNFVDETLKKRPKSSCHSEFEEEGNVCNKSRIHSPKITAIHPPLNNNTNEKHFVELPSYDSENSKEETEETQATNKAIKSQNSSVDAMELTIQGYLRKNLKYQCNLCQEPCESFAELRQHFNNDHDQQKAYVVCCDEKFRTRQSLAEHVKTHLNPGCFQCQHCRKVLKNKRNFRAHIRRWHKEKTLPCRSCNKRFISQTEYEEHKFLHHIVDKSETRIQSLTEKTDSEEVEMDQTEMDNEMDSNSEQHENDDEVDTSKEISLEVTVYDDKSLLEAEKDSQRGMSGCGTKTTPEDLMEFDEFLEHNYKFTCHLCDKPEETHENFLTLRQHFAAIHEVEGYAMCCGTKFKRRRGLVDHIKGHLDPNYLKCKYCSRNLRDRRSLFNHMAFHEGNIRHCLVCDKKFYDPIKYESHRLTHSPKDQEDDEIDSYKDSDDDLPLLQTIRNQTESKSPRDIETTPEMDLLDGAEMYTEETSEVSKPLPDYSKNFQRQLEHDEFLAKHYKLVCPVCEEQHKNVQFQTFALLRDHFALEHKDDAYVICCAYKFKKRDTLVQHIKTHLNPDDFKCEFCLKILKTKRNLQYHIRARHEGKLYRCDICKKKFVEEMSLKRHRRNHKPNESTNFPCPECDRTYKIKHKLTHHINTTHRQRYARLCDICGGYFRDINLFNAHMKTKHAEESEKEKFPCKVCGRILAARASYRLHMKTQHPENDEYAFTCHICSKPIATRGLLNYHIRMCHKTTKQHKCTVCGKAYKELKGLRGHMGIHTGESLFKCNFCPKAFNSTGNRSTHRKKCHPKEWEEFQKKMYIQDIQ